jgi:hypothetical protein
MDAVHRLDVVWVREGKKKKKKNSCLRYSRALSKRKDTEILFAIK